MPRAAGQSTCPCTSFCRKHSPSPSRRHRWKRTLRSRIRASPIARTTGSRTICTVKRLCSRWVTGAFTVLTATGCGGIAVADGPGGAGSGGAPVGAAGAVTGFGGMGRAGQGALGGAAPGVAGAANFAGQGGSGGAAVGSLRGTAEHCRSRPRTNPAQARRQSERAALRARLCDEHRAEPDPGIRCGSGALRDRP